MRFPIQITAKRKTRERRARGQRSRIVEEHLVGGYKGCLLLKGDVARDVSQRRFLARHNVEVLEQCCNYSKQCRNNVAKLCCAKDDRCESSRVTSP